MGRDEAYERVERGLQERPQRSGAGHGIQEPGVLVRTRLEPWDGERTSRQREQVSERERLGELRSRGSCNVQSLYRERKKEGQKVRLGPGSERALP